ncbi:DUF1683 family protein [Pelomyxa schiedti]|nr:DUF1683 family protein [Pelomyxa schiedti]
MDEYPDEIRRQPLPVVGIVGGAIQINGLSLESLLVAATCQAQLAQFQTTTPTAPITLSQQPTSSSSSSSPATSSSSPPLSSVSSTQASQTSSSCPIIPSPSPSNLSPAVVPPSSSISSPSSVAPSQPTMIHTLHHSLQHLAICQQKRIGVSGERGLASDQQLSLLQSLMPPATKSIPQALQLQLNQMQLQIQTQQALPLPTPIHGRLTVHSLPDLGMLPGERKKKEMDGYVAKGLFKSSWLFKMRGRGPQQEPGNTTESEEPANLASSLQRTFTPVVRIADIRTVEPNQVLKEEEPEEGLSAASSSEQSSPLPGSLASGSASGTALGSLAGTSSASSSSESPQLYLSTGSGAIPAMPVSSPPIPVVYGTHNSTNSHAIKSSPACVILFFHLTDERQWPQKQTEILSAVQQVKRRMRGRSTKIIVSLILNTSVADVNDEHIALLKKNNDHDALFLACGTAEVKAHISHVEKSAYEAALSHYSKEVHKKISRLSHVTKSATPMAVNARLLFKIAHLNEFRQDASQASRYYQQAYMQMRELKLTEEKRQDQPGSITLNEIKHLADWINFKLVTMYYLQMQNLTEAVQQFHKHMVLFRRVVNLPEIEFEHWGWVAKQYKAFAELLQLIPTLVPACRGQKHPSFYYQAAAQYTMERRRHACVSCEPLRESPLLPEVRHLPKSPYMKLDYSTQFYLGQLGSSNIASPDSKLTHAHTDNLYTHVYTLIAYELSCVEHTRFALSLYNAALAEYMSVPHAKRAMSSLSCQIAICHYQLEEWEKAKMIADKLADNYRNEQWWDMLVLVLAISRDCARRIGGDRTPNFISNSLELLLPCLPTTETEKKCIQSSLTRIIDKTTAASEPVPSRKPLLHFGKPMPDLTITDVDKLTLQSSLRLHLAQNYSLLSCEVHWKKTLACAGEPLVFTVKITSRFVSEIRFTLLRASFHDPRFSVSWINPSSAPPNPSSVCTELVLAPGLPKVFSYEILPKDLDHIECTAVSLIFGSETGPYLEFSWKVCEWTPANTDPSYKPVTSVRITERPPQLKISVVHTAPALIDELYELTISLKNDEEQPIQGGSITFDIRESPIYFFDVQGNKQQGVSLTFNQIPQAGIFTTRVFVHCIEITEKTLQIKVAYTTADGYRSCVGHSECLTPQKPFSIRFNFFDADTLLPVLPLAQPQPISPPSPIPGANKTAFNLLAANPTTCLSLAKPFLVNVVLQPHPSINFPLHLHELNLDIAPPTSNSDNVVQLLAVTPSVRTKASNDVLFTITKDQQHNSWFMLEAKPPEIPRCSSPTIGSPGPATTTGTAMTQTPIKKLTLLGTLHVVWSRSPSSPHRVTTSASFPKVEFTNPPWRWHIENDTEGVVGVPLHAILTISNFSTQPQDFILQVKDSGKFLVSGIVSCSTVSVPPHSTLTLPLWFIPQISGSQSLPPLCIAPRSLADLMPSVSVVFSSCAPPVVYPKPVFIRPCASPCYYLR